MIVGRSLAALLVPIVALSCTGPTLLRVPARHGEVLVPESMGRETGELFARSLDRLTPQVARFLGVPPSRSVTVRLREEPLVSGGGRPGLGGVTFGPDREIHLASGVLKARVHSYIIAHELVHWHFREQGWRPPHVVEEVYADFVALFFGPTWFLQARLDELDGEGIEADPAVLLLTKEDLDALPHAEEQRLLLSAFKLVRSIGFDRIPQLVADGVDFGELIASEAGP